MMNRPSGDETTVVRGGTTRHVVEEGPAPGAPPPEPFIDPGLSYEAPGEPVAAEEERLTVGPDGQVQHQRERVERRPMRGPFDDFWPALALLLLAALIGLGAFWYFTRSEEKAVPSVTSQPLDTAVSRLQDEGFKTDIVNRANAAPRGTVFEQRPSASHGARGGKHRDDPRVHLARHGRGSKRRRPSRAAGSRPAGERGPRVRVFEVFSDEPEGTVIAQNPGSGERVSPDNSVRLNVSKGTGLVDVPSLVGLTRAEAERSSQTPAWRQTSSRCPSIEPAGTVVAQNPVGGTPP